jgi:heterodisulfide reductase subunit A-like polyferredoxin
VVEHGATIIATGGKEYSPTEYLYGKNPNVMTHFDFDAAMEADDSRIDEAETVAFIQCVGSRTEERPYCSRLCCTHTMKNALELKKKTGDECLRPLQGYPYLRFQGRHVQEGSRTGVILSATTLKTTFPM